MASQCPPSSSSGLAPALAAVAAPPICKGQTNDLASPAASNIINGSDLIPPANVPIPSGLIVRHIVPRSMLLELLAAQQCLRELQQRQLTSNTPASSSAPPPPSSTPPPFLSAYGYASKSDQGLGMPLQHRGPDPWEHVLALLPRSLNDQAEDFVSKLRHSSSGIGCDMDGTLTINGRRVPNGNMADIMIAVLRRQAPMPDVERYWKNKEVAGLTDFLYAFAKSSLPVSLLRNAFFYRCVQKLRSRSCIDSW